MTIKSKKISEIFEKLIVNFTNRVEKKPVINVLIAITKQNNEEILEFIFESIMRTSHRWKHGVPKRPFKLVRSY